MSNMLLVSATIRWNFTDNADHETGFRLYDESGSLIASTSSNATYIDETEASAGVIHRRYIKAYNSYGESSASDEASIGFGAPARVNFIPETVVLIPSASSTQSTSTISATPTQNTASQTPLTKEAQIRQIRSQIADIQQKLIILISRLIQLLQEQLSQL